MDLAFIAFALSVSFIAIVAFVFLGSLCSSLSEYFPLLSVMVVTVVAMVLLAIVFLCLARKEG